MKNLLRVTFYNLIIPLINPFIMLFIKGWRRRAIGMLSYRPGDRVLIPGIGDGYDLPYLPDIIKVEGVDISAVMLSICKVKLKSKGRRDYIKITKMDAENLEFEDNSFDKAILNLFLSSVYDPEKAFSEVMRVLKPGSEIVIFDQLVRRGQYPRFLTKPLDVVLSFGFVSVGRVFEDIIEGHPVSLVKVVKNDPFGLLKTYHLITD